MHLFQYVKAYTALPMEFIAGLFPFLLSKRCICCYHGLDNNGKYFSLTTSSLPVKFELNSERSSISLT